jgi:hypothetical protein
LVTLSFSAPGAFAPVLAQETSGKTFVERARESRDKIVASMESAARAAGDEYSRLRSETARAKGPAREKLAAEMEALSKKWAAAREKLTASLDAHTQSVGDSIKKLEEKAARATGSTREQTGSEMDKLREEWHAAREKLGAALSSNTKAARDEFAHLKEQSAGASADTRARLASRMETLKAEWGKNREKLAAHLDADLKQAKEEIDKLGAETTDAARLAKEKLAKRYQDLRVQRDELAREKSIDQ